MKMRKLSMSAGALIAAMSIAAVANAATPCAVTGLGAFAATVNYDPFSTSGSTTASGTLTLTRNDNHVHDVYMYFTAPVGTTPGLTLTGPAGAGVNSLFYAPTYTGAPDLIAHTGAGLISVFGTSSGSDTVTLSFTITMPPGLDVTAAPFFPLGVRYICNGVGQISDVTSPVDIASALSISVKILSALQASYVGSAIDFGEIGTILTGNVGTPGTVLGSPATYTRSGNIRVASTGPYQVDLSSNNGPTNPYRLRNGGSGAGDFINYSVTFLGTTVSNGSSTFAQKHCVRAGISGLNLPISGTLKEGGSGKSAPFAYSDILTVTVTPQVTDGAAAACP
jgi:hypothetical protein